MKSQWLTKAVACLAALAAVCGGGHAWAGVKNWGANIHPITNPTIYPPSNYPAMFAAMRARGINHVRVDVPLQPWTDATIVGSLTGLVTQAAAYGISVEPVLMLPFAAGDRTDNGKYPAGDHHALYLQGYNRVMAFIPYFRNNVRDWELGNEIFLLNTVNGVPLYGKGSTLSEFNTPVMADWAYLLKGMSDAITDINAQYGTAMRRVLGTGNTMFGFIAYMKAMGVKVDVLGYHYYGYNGDDPTNILYLYSPGYMNIFQSMASFGVPVHVNEMNCAEIYQSGYAASSSNAYYLNCLYSLNSMLNSFSGQKLANIENIDAYEFLDESNRVVPENRFGLYYNLSTPRAQAYIFEMYAGGTLTSAEKLVLTSKGISVK